jgi:hypothetical protein
MDEDQIDQYIVSLRSRGLIGDITSIWNAIPPTARNLMITMWIKRDTSRTSIAHPIPSVEQALRLIRPDRDLTPAEIILAQRTIPVAVGKQGKRLFSDNSSN